MLANVRSAPNAVRHFFVEDVLQSMRVILLNGGDAYEALGEQIRIDEQLSRLTFVELRAWYTSVCTRIADYLAQIRSARPKCIADRVLALFHEDCSRDFSMQELAGIFYMNPAYLGQVFKKETGTTIHACLTEIRMEQAKRLLTQSDMPIYEVGERSGYPNLRNFFTVFKRCTGCTPGQYREGSKTI